MKLYKLTDSDGKTRGGMQWGAGVTHSATGDENQDLCSDAWIHAYTSPLLVVLLNPIGANFSNPRMFEAEGMIGKSDHGLKVGCRTLTTVREIPLPSITTEQRVTFAILCAQQVYSDISWHLWADDWLTGKDRSAGAAAAVAEAAAAVAEAAAVRAAAGAAHKPLDLIAIAEQAVRS